MQSFEELLQEAETVSDKREKAAKKIIKAAREKFIPEFCDAIKSLGYSSVLFELKKNPTPMYSWETRQIEGFEDKHCFRLRSDQSLDKICRFVFDGIKCIEEKYADLENYAADGKIGYLSVNELTSFEGVLELLEAMPYKLDELIDKTREKVDRANEVLEG